MASKIRGFMVGSVIQRSLSKLLITVGFRGVSISEVKVSSDLLHAKVYFCAMMDEGSEELLLVLEELRPLIFKKLRKILSCRVPVLDFRVDSSYNNYDNIERILTDIRQ